MIDRWTVDVADNKTDTREAEELWLQDQLRELNPMRVDREWLIATGQIPPDPVIDEGGGDGGGGSDGGGGGGGGGAARGSFAPPSNQIGWMPRLDLPTWVPPAPFKAPAPFEGIGNFSYPEYQKPADYVPGEFSYADYVKPADYVPGTFNAPTIAEARNEPGFQFALDEGRRQMEASAAAKGIGRTGGTVKRLIGYGQEMADTNYNSVFNRGLNTFNTNEGNREQAYGTNLAAGLGAYNTNRGNAFDNFATNYGVAKDKYDYGYKSASDEYESLYGTSRQKHEYDTAEALGEFKPRETEATLTHQQAFAEWLAKMGIAENIFNEGSD